MNEHPYSMIYGTAWKEERTTALVEEALSVGFRAIDTANQAKHYQEAFVGEAIARSGIKRKELFLQTKFTSVRGQDHRLPYDPDADLGTQVKQSFTSSLEHLRTDFIDSYLLHGPITHPRLSTPDFEIWATLEELQRSERARAIGISNVNAQQLSQLLERAEIKPGIVQNRCLAERGFDSEVREICAAAEITYQGFWLLSGNPQLVGSKTVGAVAKKLTKTPQQVMYRFYLQNEITPLTGTCNPDHMKEALEVCEFELSVADVGEIERIAR